MRTLLAWAAASAALLAGASPATAQDARLNGFWNIDAAHRAQVFRTAHVELTPAGQAAAKADADATAAMRAKGEFVGASSGTCGVAGVPFIINTSEPWLLIVDKHEVTQIFERYLLTPRHYYLDGRDWPDFSKMPPSSSGYSIAHWEGKDLVIQTRDLPPGSTYGGGRKGPDTLLTERVSLDDKGDRLAWTYTWEDPALMTTPLTYTIYYDRAPPHTYALTQYCDPNEEPGLVAEPPEQLTPDEVPQ